MRFKRVLLVNPPYTGFLGMAYTPPVGLGYIAESLKANGIDYDVIDMCLGYTERDLLQKVREYNPDCLGISMLTRDYKASYNLINAVRREVPNIGIVAGGPHISTQRENVLQQCPTIDYGVVKEGEHSMVKICQGEDPANIEGVIYRQNGEVKFTGAPRFIQDLDALPAPRYEKFELDRYLKQAVGMVSSRGCPYSCIFCSVNAVMGRQMRMRSAENFVKELSYWYHRGYRTFEVWDDNFTFYPNRVYEICDLIEENGLTGIKFIIPNGVRADKVDYPMLKRMKEVGFQKIAFGVESGSDRVLKIIKKAEKLQDLDRAIREATELDYDVVLFFIIGIPGETVEDVEKSFDLALRYPVAAVNFYNVTPLPGTELYDWIMKQDILLRFPEDYLNEMPTFSNKPLFETPELSIADRKHLLTVADSISKQVKARWIARRLGIGFAGELLGKVYVSDMFQGTVGRHRGAMGVVERFKSLADMASG